MLLRISSYWSVLPHHTAGQLIIHFIIPPTAYTHTLSQTPMYPQGGERASRHLCRYTALRHTQKEAPDNFSIKTQTPTDYPPRTAASNCGLVYQSMHRTSFKYAYTWIKHMYTHLNGTNIYWCHQSVGTDMKEIIYLIDSISPNVGRIILE